jgi:flagellar secretion chaperone FliS
MSYSQANVYREREVLTASPEKLVVITFDHVLVNLRRARMAIEAGNVELRVQSLGRAREGVMELLVSTDVERGGEIASNLRALYAFALREFLAIGRSRDVKQLDGIANVISNLRDAFASIATPDRTLARSPAA